MDIIFLMKNWTEDEFQKQPGVRKVLRELEISGDSWKYQSADTDFTDEWIGKKGKWQRIFGKNRGNKKEEQLVITDCADAAEELPKQKICCIGYQEADASEFFPGVRTVITSFENLDRTYLETVHHHFHGMPVQIAQTARLVIRESIREDFEVLYQLSREEGNERYMEIPSSDRALEEEKFNAYISQVYDCLGFGLWTVLLRDTKKIIGRCGLSVLEEDRGNGQSGKMESSGKTGIEIGYLIGKNHRKCGYAKEACRAILDYAHQNLDCQEIWAVIHRENTSSRKLAETFGFLEKEEREKRIWYKKEWKEAL